jgi:hypothetical protein
MGEWIILDPRKIFIMNDGLVKLINPNMLNKANKYVFSESIYYAP